MRASVLRPDGTLITTPGDGGRETQLDTVQCCHCGRHWVWERAMMEAIRGEMGFCQRCNHPTCGESCQECVPQEQMLENMEAGHPWHAAKLIRPVRVGGFNGSGNIWTG